MINIAELRAVAKVELAKKDNNSILTHRILLREYNELSQKENLTNEEEERLISLKDEIEEALIMQYLEIDDVVIELLTDPNHIDLLAQRSCCLGNIVFTDKELMEKVLKTGLFSQMWEDFSKTNNTTADSILLGEFVNVYDMVLNHIKLNEGKNLSDLVEFNNQYQRFDGSLVNDLLDKIGTLGEDKTLQLLNDFSSSTSSFAKLPIGYRAIRFSSLENTMIDENLDFYTNRRFMYDVKKYGMDNMADEIIETANKVRVKKFLQDKNN